MFDRDRRLWIRTFLLAAAIVTVIGQGHGFGQANPDPRRFEKDIAAFEAQDLDSRRVSGAVVFVGSSTIRYWDTDKGFPNLTIVKRGFGGSHVSDNIYYADRIILPYKPKLIVFYAGDADVAGRKSADQIAADYKTFIADIHAKLPAARLVILAIKPSPAHWNYIDTIRKTNVLVREYIESDRMVTYVDVSEKLLGSDGRPDPKLYADNGLNFNEIGYRVWTEAVRPFIEGTFRLIK